MSFIDYSNIKTYIEGKIAQINTLTPLEAAQVAVNAIQLQRTGNKPSNYVDLETYLQSMENTVDADSTLKDVTILLGASAPTKNVIWQVNKYFTSGTFTTPANLAGGMVYVTALAGGGSGAAGYSTSGYLNITGGCGGGYERKIAMRVQPSTSYAISVGLGGFGESRFTTGAANGSDGASTLFDGTVIAYGGKGGRQIQYPVIAPYQTSGNSGGFFQPIHTASSGAVTNMIPVMPQNGYQGAQGGANTYLFSGSVGAYCGGGAGSLGPGTSANAQLNSTCSSDPCAVNTGAGSGAACVVYTSGSGFSAVTGIGGSGLCIVEYQVYL